jgi:chemotaxis protein methyltransferase CheR
MTNKYLWSLSDKYPQLVLDMELSRTTFDELRRLIHRLCGIVIADEKEYLIRHRLESLVMESDCLSYDEFFAKLSSLDRLRWQEAVVESITTRETSFFRDRHPFEAVKNCILPELITTFYEKKPILVPPKLRFLSCGAATGQEPYSLAMSISEYLAARHPTGIKEHDFSIVAADISANALDYAAAAKYRRHEINRGLSEEHLKNHFMPQGDEWTVKPHLRQLVEFRRLNLLTSLSGLGRFHLILCRNVLIYFDEPTRQRLCTQLFEMLNDGGWLILGSAESLFGINHAYQSHRHGDTLLFRKP